MLWAWERPEDLRFIDPARVGVAVLARSITLRDGAMRVVVRRQALRVPPATYLVAVARIEARGAPPDGARVADVAGAVASLDRLPGVRAVQIDFDAAVSQRAFYAALLAEVRRRLAPEIGLSITALASWCAGDAWLTDAPVEQLVPMLFRMGADGPAIRRRLDHGSDFAETRCRSDVGLATDEPAPRIAAGRRRWVFHPRSWTAAAVAALEDAQ